MRKRCAALALALAISLATAVAFPAPAAAVENGVGAEVIVTTLINFTVQDNGAPGLRFGSLYPGSANSPELAQGGRGAVTLSIGAETNVRVQLGARANDFTSADNALAISNAKWHTSNDASAAFAMATTYTRVGNLNAGGFLDLWHWLSIPLGQAPGTYSTTFYYQAVTPGA